MTTQEILASLSQLEQELQSIRSARALVDETVGAYAEVKNDIKSLLNEFESVTKSLNSISLAFETENETLTTEIQNSITVVKGQLDTLNTAFANQCNSVIMRFMERVNKAGNDLSVKTEALSGTYERNNNDFKSSIKELASVHSSLIKAAESVISLKADIAAFQEQLNQSQKDQDATLEKIASQLQATGNSHTQILTQIANDLKSSQDAQDEDLNELKEAHKRHSNQVDNVIETQKSIEKGIESTNSSITNLGRTIVSKFESSDKNVENVFNVSKSVKTLIYINIVLSVIAILIALFK